MTKPILQAMPISGDVLDRPLLEPIKTTENKDAPNEEGRYVVSIIEDETTGTLCWNRCVKVLTTTFNFSAERANATCHRLNSSRREPLVEYDTEEEADNITLAATQLFHENPCCNNHAAPYPFVYDKI